jgi:hypothetical protein
MTAPAYSLLLLNAQCIIRTCPQLSLGALAPCIHLPAVCERIAGALASSHCHHLHISVRKQSSRLNACLFTHSLHDCATAGTTCVGLDSVIAPGRLY